MITTSDIVHFEDEFGRVYSFYELCEPVAECAKIQIVQRYKTSEAKGTTWVETIRYEPEVWDKLCIHDEHLQGMDYSKYRLCVFFEYVTGKKVL